MRTIDFAIIEAYLLGFALVSSANLILDGARTLHLGSWPHIMMILGNNCVGFGLALSLYPFLAPNKTSPPSTKPDGL